MKLFTIYLSVLLFSLSVSLSVYGNIPTHNVVSKLFSTNEVGIDDRIIIDGVAYVVLTDSTARATAADHPYKTKRVILDTVVINEKKHVVTQITKVPQKTDSIYLPKTLERIDKSAFYGCSNMSYIYFSENTMLKKIESGVFAGCVSLQKIDNLPQTIIEIDKKAFYNCSQLQLDISTLKELCIIGEDAFAFSNVSVRNWEELELLKIIGDGAFSMCKNLTEVRLKCDSIGTGAFAGCYNIERFEMMTTPKSKAVPNRVICGFESFDDNTHEIKYKSALKTVILSPSIQQIGDDAFANCLDLDSIVLPACLQSIGRNAFVGCKSLCSINIPEHLTISCPWVDVFDKCFSLKKIDVSEKSAEYLSIDGVVYSKDKKTLIYCPQGISDTLFVPDFVEIIGRQAFKYKGLANAPKTLSKVVIPHSVKEVSDSAFQYNATVETIVFQDNSLLNRIGKDAFFGAEHLKKVSLGEASQLKEIDVCAFQYCIALEEIILPPLIERIIGNVFMGCNNLKRIVARGDIPAEMSNQAFENETYETAELNIPFNSKELYKQSTGWMNFKNITYRDIPEGIKPIHDFQYTIYKSDTLIYDLQGRKVSNPSQRGVYISGGRKVFVK